MNYAAAAARALKMFTKQGSDVTHRSVPTGTYTPGTGVTGRGTTDTVRKGVLFDFAAGQVNVRGSLVQGGDKRLLLSASPAVLMTDRFIVPSGQAYSVVSIGEINPAGTRVLYDLHVRT